MSKSCGGKINKTRYDDLRKLMKVMMRKETNEHPKKKKNQREINKTK